MRHFDPSEYVAYNRAAAEKKAERDAKEKAKADELAAKEAEQRAISEKWNRMDSAARQTITEGAKATKGKVGTIEITLNDKSKETTKATIFGDIAVHKTDAKTDPWKVTHIPTGLGMGSTFATKGQAVEATWLLNQGLDWSGKKASDSNVREAQKRLQWFRFGTREAGIPEFLGGERPLEQSAEKTKGRKPAKAKGEEGESEARRVQREAEESRKDTETHGMFGGGVLSLERQRADTVPDSVKAPNEDVERRLQAARGLRKPSLIERIKNTVKLVRGVLRATEYIPGTARFAAAREFFRLLKNVPVMAQDEAIRTTAAIVDPLGKQQLALFERFAIVENQLAALEMGQPLRFGFGSKEEVEAYRDQLQALVDGTPEVKQALESRRKVVKELVEQLVEYDLLPENALDRSDTYYHQQVHFYMMAQKRATAGGTRPGKIGRTFQRKRVEGKELAEEMDYNTSYLEAEASWMTDAMMELEKEKLLRNLMGQYDIKQQLKDEAKTKNFENLVGGPEVVSRINELRGLIAESRESEDAQDSAERMMRKEWIEELQEIDPTYPYRIKIAMFLGKLKKSLGLEADKDFEDGEMWGIVSKAANAGDMNARGALKAVNDQREFIKTSLGKDYLTWQKLAAQSEDYSVFQPEPGNNFYRASTIPERIVEQLQQDVIASAELTKDDLRIVLALGLPRRQFVVPTELADQLNAARKHESPHGLAKLSDAAMKGWKVWTLMNPKRAVQYNVRNETGDIDPIVAAVPGALQYMGRAAQELQKYHGSRLSLSNELRLARDLGVIGSGFTAEEVPDLKDLPIFQRFFEPSGKSKGLIRLPAKYFEVVKKYTEFRENMLRYAAFLHYLAEAKAGKISHYGGASKGTVDALIQDMGPEVAAAHLARNLLGDYGNLTVAGDWIRRRLMPFWAFQEINLKRYPRLAINAYEAGMTRNFVLSRAAATAVLGLRIAWMYGTLWAWNRLLFGDDDDELLPYDRANPHLLLGRNPDGSIRVFRNVGAMGDFLEWIGLNELPSLLKKYRDKQIEPGEIVSEMARAPLEKAVSSLRPDIKGVAEVLSGQTWFPEPLQPRSVRRGESAASVFGLGDEYKWAAGKILGDGQRPRRHYWQRWFFGVTDPRAAALSDIYDLRSSFLKTKGSEEAGVFPVSQYKEARDAAINEDYDAFVEWKKKFVSKHGRTSKNDFEKFLGKIDPIASRLNSKDEVEFERKYLTSEQRQKLIVARQYAGELKSLLLTWWKASKIMQ